MDDEVGVERLEDVFGNQRPIHGRVLVLFQGREVVLPHVDHLILLLLSRCVCRFIFGFAMPPQCPSRRFCRISFRLGVKIVSAWVKEWASGVFPRRKKEKKKKTNQHRKQKQAQRRQWKEASREREKPLVRTQNKARNDLLCLVACVVINLI